MNEKNISPNESPESGSPEMATLEIHKGPEATLEIGGLRMAACRREIGEIDGGVSVCVFRASIPDQELVRMDLFRARPHYHAPATNQAEESIETESGSANDWGVKALSEQSRALVIEAGFTDAADEIDLSELGAAKDRLRNLFDTLGEKNDVSYFEVPKSMIESLAEG